MNVAQYEMIFQLEGYTNLEPFAGLHIKNLIGTGLFRTQCLARRQRCILDESTDSTVSCEKSSGCKYFEIFRPVVKVEKNDRVIRHKPQLSFSISPPLQTHFLPGDQLRFELRLFGRGIANLPYFIQALDRTGTIGFSRNKKKCRLITVLTRSASQRSEMKTVYSSMDRKLVGHSSLQTVGENQLEKVLTDSIRIEFKTPADMTYHGKRFDPEGPSFSVLIASILGRVSSLAHHHLEPREKPIVDILPVEFWRLGERNGKKVFFYQLPSEARSAFMGDLIEASQEVEWERASAKLSRVFRWYGKNGGKKLLKGVMGSITYHGENIGRFIPILEWGRLVGTGQKTSHGYGVYEITGR